MSQCFQQEFNFCVFFVVSQKCWRCSVFFVSVFFVGGWEILDTHHSIHKSGNCWMGERHQMSRRSHQKSRQSHQQLTTNSPKVTTKSQQATNKSRRSNDAATVLFMSSLQMLRGRSPRHPNHIGAGNLLMDCRMGSSTRVSV